MSFIIEYAQFKPIFEIIHIEYINHMHLFSASPTKPSTIILKNKPITNVLMKEDILRK